MSTAPLGGSGVTRILSQFSSIHRSNPGTTAENQTSASNISTTTAPVTNDRTWINTFNRLDRSLTASLLYLLYRATDITLLFIGLSSGPKTCSTSSGVAATSISLLVFYFIDLMLIAYFFIRNVCSRNSQLTEQQKLERLRSASSLRGLFNLLKLIPICIGTGFSFTATVSKSNDCELTRFCLGMVCLSTWLVILMPPGRPELPVRRSLIFECFILAFVLIINCTYIGTVAKAMQNAPPSTCTYNNTEDLYVRSPLKSYAYAGVILFGCTTTLHIINLAITQLCSRLNGARRFYIYYYAFQYIVDYIAAIVVVYYFSIGALFLFQPRLGQPCRESAPDLYRTLLIWEWIRILFPLVFVPLVVIFCCLGVFVGIVLSYCLPASITVPILEAFQRRMPTAPGATNPNPPATQENIDTIPTISFGQEPDQFNQTECAICQTNFEANEQLKKLQCGHLFHSECVTNWLLITRICPVCRQRMSVTNP